MLDRDDVLRARATLGDRIVRTPTIRALGAHLKCEFLQHTGSFKARGALNRIDALTPDERGRGVITTSAGNHAAAVAWAAATAGVDALIVMARGVSPYKVDATRAYGATVDLEAENFTEAFERMHAIADASGRTVVHPHEDPLVLAGAGTLALEIEEDAPGADAVLVAVGGGGLIAGIAAAVGDRLRVIAVEPERAPAFHDAIAHHGPVPAETASIADGCNAPRLGRLPYDLCHTLERHLVTEDEIREAFRALYSDAKLAVEPAGAVAAAALLAGKIQAESPVVVVSGGNVSTEISSGILASR